ncbi:outer membrane lipoprotein OmlA [Alcanivorax hongdengensis A-11-3]|uniref:Outer membrane protein assembly factor BamE n=1 Tax=Alcanivorax hongdengensis A-11-3 TaxID=1177179 RepID=L0WHT9_9GAMM|nr:outer membrane protein assembly factor BamE [Alcanivorax hongdengensis]EKF75380.1 outer membrane lipoprotein OmlA [Alcanivorax hongdengensis A-11-3]
MPRLLFPIALIALIATAGCSSLHFPGVYRIDIPQGNFVTEDMLKELKPGMTPDQVRFVMGPPTLVDPFTPDMWFYLMTYRPGQGDKVHQNILVYFNNGTYDHYEGQVIDDFRSKTSGRKDLELQEKARERKDDAAG